MKIEKSEQIIDLVLTFFSMIGFCVWIFIGGSLFLRMGYSIREDFLFIVWLLANVIFGALMFASWFYVEKEEAS